MYDNYKIKPLDIIIPKAKAYVKRHYNQTKWMYFLVEDDSLLEKYNTICDKVSADMKNNFDSGPVYNTKSS